MPFDVRRAQPYWAYDRIEFEIAVGKNGDNFDRYLVRMAEMEQSMRIAEQALDKLPGGALNVDAQGRPIDPPRTWTAASRGRPKGCCSCRSRCRPTSRGRGGARRTG